MRRFLLSVPTGLLVVVALLTALLLPVTTIAIVDMELPGDDGATTIAELRRVQPDIRILVVSGHDDRRYILAALETG